MRLHPCDPRFIEHAGRDNNAGGRGGGADVRQECCAISVGEHQIEHDGIDRGFAGREHREALHEIFGDGHFAAGALKQILQRRAAGRIILNNEHALFSGLGWRRLLRRL